MDIHSPHKINLGFIEVDINPCVTELVQGSYQIYNYLLSKGTQITLICGGQSPAYFCLSMMHLQCYDPTLVEIIILPHSKGGQISENDERDNQLYCERLCENEIVLRNNVTILDGVHNGVGILALESVLKSYDSNITIEKIAINYRHGISNITVDKEFYFKCVPKFSDVYLRLVNSYHPRDFHDSSKFVTSFNIEENGLAHMIIGVSKDYPNHVNNEWFKLNHTNKTLIETYKDELKKISNKTEREILINKAHCKGKLNTTNFYELRYFINEI
jgi:hypothetical protein